MPEGQPRTFTPVGLLLHQAGWEHLGTPTRSPSFPRTRDAHGAKRDGGAQGPAAQHTHLQTFRLQGGRPRGWPARTEGWVSVVGASGPSRARGKEPVNSQAEGRVGGGGAQSPLLPRDTQAKPDPSLSGGKATRGTPRGGGRGVACKSQAEPPGALYQRARLGRGRVHPLALPNGVRRSPPGARHWPDLNSSFPLMGRRRWGGSELG